MYRTKIRFFAIATVLAIGSAAALAVWSVRATDQHRSHAKVAHDLLNEHLNLSVYAYRLFKQLTDEILLGTDANQSVVRNKRSAISSTLERIRSLEWQQRTALGPEAAPNAVEDTDALEGLIESILRDFESLLELPDNAVRAERVAIILEDRIDVSFREAVNAALERQGHVVEQMDRKIERVHAWLVALSAALALAALILAVGGNHVLIRGITLPLSHLQQAASRLGKGRFEHRVPEGFDSEFNNIARAFNAMAQQLFEQHTALEQNQRRLETAVRERTSELTEANSALKQSDRVRRQFLADVSHELRTPLTVIRGEAQVALRAQTRPTQEYQEALQAILDQAIDLGRLVDDMLFVARTDAQTLRLSRSKCELSKLCQEAVRDIRTAAEQKGIEMTLDLPDQPVHLLADPGRLQQLMLILLDNAVRYGETHSKVTVSLTAAEQHVQIAVSDQGHGIDPQDLPYIFERFFRANHGRDNAPGGSGLGLAVAKAIVTAHGGSIEADSTIGEGTRMTVQLPSTA